MPEAEGLRLHLQLDNPTGYKEVSLKPNGVEDVHIGGTAKHAVGHVGKNVQIGEDGGRASGFKR